MRKPFIFFEKLKEWEIIVPLLYGILTFLIFNNVEEAGSFISMYVILSQLFLYLFLYVSLRNFTTYLIWCAFALIHAVLYFKLKDNPALQMYRGNEASGLINTIILLVLFQLLRFFSFKIQGREFVAPSKNGIDLFENKSVTYADYTICLIYMIVGFGLYAYELK
ncbi:MAG: hypothetical protein V4592_10345 [Bacteroidota bacterium]